MPPRRPIKQNEVELIQYLLKTLGLQAEDFPVATLVEEYEGGIMGSIGLGNHEEIPYDGDFIQVNYIDTDGVPVVITLTKNTDGQLLDLDFWKQDFSKLITYPKPEDISIAH